MIPYGRQAIDADDIQAVVDVLKSDFLTQGPVLPSFEDAIASRVGARHAIAVNSATSALHIACMALDLGPEDTLWTVPITFVASANVALYCGASVDFVDIDPTSLTLCPDALERKLKVADKMGKLPKILVPVHFSGRSCDMKRINALASSYGVRVIEDASHAIGAEYLDTQVGCGQYSDITVFSFHPVKIITTGEGGMACTQDRDLASKMELARSHGVTRDPSLMESESDGAWYYQQVGLGYNYRMTDLQAALGISQLSRLDQFIKRRREIAAQYHDALRALPLTLPICEDDGQSSWHLYVVQLDLDLLQNSKSEVFDEMRNRGIGVNVHYIPVHLQPFYRKRGFSAGDFPLSETYYSRALTLPLHPGMSDADVDTVVSTFTDVLAG